jgi:hypothetical protein
MDGVDMSRRSVGDVIDLSQHDAEMFIAEGWALRADSELGIGERHAIRGNDLDKPRTRRKHHA